MKIALCVLPTLYEMPRALASMRGYIAEAASAGAGLIVFPETALLGLEIVGDIEQDRELCLELDSQEFEGIKSWALQNQIHVCFGFLEYERGFIYDSAMIIDKTGNLVFKYRRISIGWMIPGVDEEHYCTGNSLSTCDLGFGKIGMLICGDLCEEDLIQQIEAQELDICLHIMARSFPITDDIQTQWDLAELPEYLIEWKRLGRYTLCVNSISTDLFKEETDYCGGAWFIRKDGTILASKALLERGLLIYDIDQKRS